MGLPVVPEVPWMRTRDSLGAHWWPPRPPSSAWVSRMSSLVVKGSFFRSDVQQISPGSTPASRILRL